jgi:hypothetical protein
MRVHRVSSLLTVSTAIFMAGLLIAATFESAPTRSSNVQAAPQDTGPKRAPSPKPPLGPIPSPSNAWPADTGAPTTRSSRC